MLYYLGMLIENRKSGFWF